MKRIIQIIASLSVALLLLVPLNVFAADGNIEYTGNSGSLVFQPGSDYSPTDLFTEFKDVMPGDKLTQTITVKNNADNKVKVKIYIRSLGADKESRDFLSKLQLTVTKQGATPMFDAKASEKAGLEDWTELGILYSGGKVNLDLTLTVPTSLDTKYENQIGKLTWQFMTVEIPTEEESSWECPDCHKKDYHIIDHEEYSEYYCDNCGHTEEMRCEICGARMRKVIYKQDDGQEWYYYICECNDEHHTEPAPQTGDHSPYILWISAIAVCTSAVILLLVIRKKRRRETPEAN